MSTLKAVLVVALFVLLTLSLYLVFFMTVPVFRDPHGLLVMNELPVSSQSSLIKEMLFGSAVICTLLGTLMMNWVPNLRAGTLGILWVLTYTFIWFDTVLALWIQTREMDYAVLFLTSLLFISLFFGLLSYLGFPQVKPEPRPTWGVEVVHAWLWGWMCFYFGLSGRFIFNSIFYSTDHFPLALGSLMVCFLNYLLYLYLRKSEGKAIDQLSGIGRIVFIAWVILLFLFWIGRQWIV